MAAEAKGSPWLTLYMCLGAACMRTLFLPNDSDAAQDVSLVQSLTTQKRRDSLHPFAVRVLTRGGNIWVRHPRAIQRSYLMPSAGRGDAAFSARCQVKTRPSPALPVVVKSLGRWLSFEPCAVENFSSSLRTCKMP